MRVGIDYLPAVCHAPGVGRYARELVRAAVTLDDVPKLCLFEVGGGGRRFAGNALGLDGARVQRLKSRAPRRAVQWLYRLTRVGADRLLGGVDVFHRIHADYPPVSKAAEVLPIPELPPADTPADAALRAAARRAARVVVFSAHYAEEIQRRYDVSPDRITYTPVGCDHWVRDLGANDTPAAPRPRIVVLGAIRNERYPLTVLRAFEALRSGGVQAQLVLAGHPASAAHELRTALARSPVKSDIEWIEAPEESAMPGLVAGATTLLHLATDEGTPVTPLEAFSFGVPVVASHLPAFTEALGDQATYVDTAEATAAPRILAEALAAQFDSAASPTAREARRRVAADYTWARCAGETIRAWRRAAQAP